jgi:soluble lytic murein transglycosylase-like protein
VSRLLRVGAAVVWCGLWAASASADLVLLDNGRHLSIRAYRLEGASIVLLLRSGGEVVVPQRLVRGITPDEVPYPDAAGAPALPSPVATAVILPAVPYGDLIDTTAARHGVDARLVRAIVEVESSYRPEARSPRGAMGLMQLMPPTAREYRLRDPYDPESNLEAGVRHLRSLLDRFEVSLALAAYNAGEGAVRRFGGIPPFPETRAYVRRVLSLTTAD